MPLLAATLVVVGLFFVGRGIFLARPGVSLARPAWMPAPSRRGLGLAALAIAPLALIAAAHTSKDKVPDAVAAPQRVDRLTGDDAARPEPKAQTTANKAPSGAAPAAATAARDAAPASARRPAPAAVPSDTSDRDSRGRMDNTSDTTDSETQPQPTPEPERPKGKGKPKDETPSSTPAPTPSGDDGDDRDD